VRILLIAAETRERMHLRRILASCPGLEVVGHLRTGTTLADTVQRNSADALLADAVDNPDAVTEILQEAGRLRLRTVVLSGEAPFHAFADNGFVQVLRRPDALETEATQSPFGRALCAALAPTGTAAPVRRKTAFCLHAAPGSQLLRPELIAIGSSTGGPQALPEVLGRLTGRIHQPIVITQHMPAAFTQMLAEHLGRHASVPTVEARDGMPLVAGRVHIAPGGSHLVLAREAEQVVCHLNDGPPENFCKPAVDPMLRSVVNVYGGRALAVILTGMGQDGLRGCRTLVEAGGSVLAQDEASSVVWGMPGAVAQAGICRAVLPLDQIADSIVALAGGAP
jgi:chemotaxis response regulator CheB